MKEKILKVKWKSLKIKYLLNLRRRKERRRKQKIFLCWHYNLLIKLFLLIDEHYFLGISNCISSVLNFIIFFLFLLLLFIKNSRERSFKKLKTCWSFFGKLLIFFLVPDGIYNCNFWTMKSWNFVVWNGGKNRQTKCVV